MKKKTNKIILLIFALFTFTTIVEAADTNTPTITNIIVNNKSVDLEKPGTLVLNPGETLDISFDIQTTSNQLDGSYYGFRETGSGFFEKVFVTNEITSKHFTYSKVVTEEDDMSTDFVVEICDRNNNCSGLKHIVTYFVEQIIIVDNDAPEISNISFNKTLLEPGESLQITFDIEDISEISTESSQYGLKASDEENATMYQITNQITNNHFTYSKVINDDEIGKDMDFFVNICDEFQNCTGLTNIGTYTVMASATDTEPPEITNISFNKTSITAGETVEATFSVSDATPDGISVSYLMHDSDYTSWTWDDVTYGCTQDDNGIYHIVENIDSGFAEKSYDFSVKVCDKYGNCNIVNIGGFTVISGGISDITPPVISEMYVSRGGELTTGTEIEFSLKVEDETSDGISVIYNILPNNETIDNTGTFSGEALSLLEDGKYHGQTILNYSSNDGIGYNIWVRACDKYNNCDIQNLGLFYIIDAPIVTNFETDQNSVTYGDTLHFYFDAESEIGINADNSIINYYYDMNNGNWTTPHYNESTGRYEASLDITEELPAGENRAELTVYDNNGNSSDSPTVLFNVIPSVDGLYETITFNINETNQVYYYKNGVIDFAREGVYLYRGNYYYVKDGKVDNTYSGYYEFEGKNYKVSHGLAQEVDLDDQNPPVFNNISLSTYNAYHGDVVYITVDASDEQEVSRVELHLTKEDDLNYHNPDTYYWIEATKDAEGTFTAALEIDDFFSQTTYKIYAKLTDIIGNSEWYNNVAELNIVDKKIHDYDAPEIKSVTLDKETAKYGDIITATIVISDDSDLQNVELRCSKLFGTSSEVVSRIIGVHQNDGTYKAYITVNDDFINGQTHDISVYAEDIYGNHAVKYDLASLEVYDESRTMDIEGPIVESITVDKNIVKIGDTLTVTLTATDASEIRYIYLSCLRNSSGSGRGAANLEKQSDGTYIGYMTIDEEFIDGETYSIMPSGYDSSGNDLRSYPTIMFIVDNDNNETDVVGPVLESITLDKETVAVEDTVKVTMNISDDSDIQNVTINVYKKGEGLSVATPTVEKQSDGTYVAYINIGYNFEKTWYAIKVSAEDSYGNTLSSNKNPRIYISETKRGLVEENGSLCYYDNGIFNSSYKGFFEFEGNRYFIQSGLASPTSATIATTDYATDKKEYYIGENVDFKYIMYSAYSDIQGSVIANTKATIYLKNTYEADGWEVSTSDGVQIGTNHNIFRILPEYNNKFLDVYFIVEEEGVKVLRESLSPIHIIGYSDDTTAPQISNIIVPTGDIEVGETIEISFDISDESPMSYIKQYSGHGYDGRDINTNESLYGITDDAYSQITLDGKYHDTLPIQFWMKDTKIDYYVNLCDQFNNCTGNITVASFNIVDTSGDVTAPVVNISLDKETVSPGDTLSFVISITDESAIDETSPYVYYERENNNGYYSGGDASFELQPDGTYTGSIEITTGFYSTRYKLITVVGDIHGNQTEIEKYFIVTGGIEGQGPTISNATISDDDVTYGDSVTVTFEAYDESGIANADVMVYLDPSRKTGYYASSYFDGTKIIYTVTFTIDEELPVGNNKAEIYAIDSNGNGVEEVTSLPFKIVPNRDGLFDTLSSDYDINIVYYYTNGEIDTTKEGIYEFNGYLCYVTNGMVDYDYNGYYVFNDTLYQITNGVAEETTKNGTYGINGIKSLTII